MFSKQLYKKIEYSIDLLRKCEDMSLRMDAENGFYLAFKWWISGKSFDEFYADEVLQQKIKF